MILKIADAFYFNDVSKIEGFDSDNTLIDEKSHENILAYNILHKSLIDSKPLRISFDKIDWFITVYDGTRYLIFFGSEKNDSVYNKIGCLINVKNSITYTISHNYAKVRGDSYDSLPLENTVTFIML